MLNYSKKDLDFLIDIFIHNKSLILYNYQLKNKIFKTKFINKFIKYLIFLGFIVNNNYQTKINVFTKKSQIFTTTVEITKKV